MSKQRNYTPGQQAERALISVMADWPLEPGQMLLIGPRSVRVLTSRGAYDPSKLIDTLVLEREEWNGPKVRKTTRPKPART